MNRLTFVAVAAILVGGGAYYYWDEQDAPASPQLPPSGIVYYYGEECPHCKEVAKYLSESGIDGKIGYEKKEVWHNRANSAEMAAKAKECGLPEDSIGAPFVSLEGKCYVGTPDVERVFREKAGI